MANEVEKFDPAQLMQGVKDRIKATFVSLIPDDKWEEMVNAEIQKFFARHSSGYNYQKEVSDFTYVVHGVLQEEAKKKIQEVLNSADFQLSFDGSEHGLPEVIRTRIVENAGKIFLSAIEGSITNAIQMMRTR